VTNGLAAILRDATKSPLLRMRVSDAEREFSVPAAMPSSPTQVAIIGAGPAGLMAAEVLAQGGAGVTVYDAMPSAGRKFLMAGRGGLNLTHSEPLPEFLSRYGKAMPQLADAITAFPPDNLREWSEALGQPTFIGSSGRVFPKAFKASPLLRAWLRRLDSIGVQFAMRTARRRFQRNRARARRRKLATAWFRWRMGGDARCKGRGDNAAPARQLRFYGCLVRDFSRSF